MRSCPTFFACADATRQRVRSAVHRPAPECRCRTPESPRRASRAPGGVRRRPDAAARLHAPCRARAGACPAPVLQAVMQKDILASLARLSDDDLAARVKSLAARERDAAAHLIAHLAEMDTR